MVKASDTLSVFIEVGSKVTCWEQGQGYGAWLEENVADLQIFKSSCGKWERQHIQGPQAPQRVLLRLKKMYL